MLWSAHESFDNGFTGGIHQTQPTITSDPEMGLWLQNNIDDFKRKGTNPYEKAQAQVKHDQTKGKRKQLTRQEVLTHPRKVNYHTIYTGNIQKKRFLQPPSIRKCNSIMETHPTEKYSNLKRIIRSKYLNQLAKDRPSPNLFSYQQDKYLFLAIKKID
jgi:hypothetical protein